jgi:hypothetical protein
VDDPPQSSKLTRGISYLKTERGGFEPPSAFAETHFECVTINHSDTSPRELIQFILEYYTTAARPTHPLPPKSIASPDPIAWKSSQPRLARFLRQDISPFSYVHQSQDWRCMPDRYGWACRDSAIAGLHALPSAIKNAIAVRQHFFERVRPIDSGLAICLYRV